MIDGPAKKLRPVMVEWIDSISASGWGELKEPEDMRCASVGHLIEKSKDRVVICQNMSMLNPGHHMTIPRVAVTRITRLKSEGTPMAKKKGRGGKRC